MPDEEPKRGINGLAPWGAMLVAFLAAIYGYGVQAQRITALEDQVREMRSDARTNAVTLAKIERSTTIIETKLQLLLPTEASRHEGAR